MKTHPAWETLNDLADRALSDAETAEVARHTERCEECRTTLHALQQVSATARSVPREVTPPPELWEMVRLSIGAMRDVVPLPMLDHSTRNASATGATPYGVASLAQPAAGRGRPIPHTWLAAAALLLIVASSGITAVVLRQGGALDVGSGGPVAVNPGAQVVPAALTATDESFIASVRELQELFDTQRSALSPSTVRVVERSLATINDAIAEARGALLADPANRELARLLAASYRQKVELLRRASELMHTS